jgi:recombination protein RecA
VETGVLARSGAWFSYKEDRIGQGRERVKEFLNEHKDLALQIEEQVKEKLGLGEYKFRSSGENAEE